jgi:hypothetical protein
MIAANDFLIVLISSPFECPALLPLSMQNVRKAGIPYGGKRDASRFRSALELVS